MSVVPGPGAVRVRRGRPLGGAVTPPGDKSITHRALLLALAARGSTTIERANDGEDCRATRALVESLGGRTGGAAARLTVEGTALELREPDAPLDCGNSGTTLRLAAGLAATNPILVVLTGDESLRRRPVGRIVEPLRRMGASVVARAFDRLPPIAVRGGGLHGVDWLPGVSSAQVATCVLLAGLRAHGATSVTLPGPARDHTERMLPAFGVPLDVVHLPSGGRHVRLDGARTPVATTIRVPGDFSAAAFFLAAGAATPGSRVTAQDVSLNPTRTGFLDVLAEMGATVEIAARRDEAGEPVGSVTVSGPAALRAFDVPAEWMPRLIDEIPAWAIVASAAHGTSRVRAAAELRVKESDRLAELAHGLAALGVGVRERPDGLDVDGGTIGPGTIATRGDHRIVMAFAAIGARAEAGVELHDAGTVATSYPDFFETLASLGASLESAGKPAAAAARRRA